MPALGDELDFVRENTELRAANARLQRANARLKEKQADLVEAVYTAAKDAAVAVGTPKPIPRPGRDRRRSPEVALLHLTDWQLGKHGESYSTAICEERVRLAVQKTIKLAEIQRADHPVRECHVALGGDLVENVTIFPGQVWEVDSNAFSQVFAAAALVEQVLVSLLAAFESVTVWEVSGNHGRIGRKGDSPREDNLDRIVGRIARERLASQARLTWEPPAGWYSVMKVGAYRALLVHGDQVKSFGGNTPAFGILRKANAWASGAIPFQFSTVFMGHFHTPMQLTMANGSFVFVTRSPESDNQYAAEFVAARGRPSQRLVFIDPVKGRETSDYVLWLDG